MSGGIGGGESGVPETLLDTKGQVHGFSTTNAAVNVGTDLQTIYADSTETLGIGYGASARSVLATTGDILAASSANTLSAISASTSGHVLTSTGAASLPTYQAAAGGGIATLLYDYTVSGGAVSQIEYDASADPITASDYAFFETWFTFAPSGAMALDFLIDQETSSYYWYGNQYNVSGTRTWVSGSNDSSADLADTNIIDGVNDNCFVHGVMGFNTPRDDDFNGFFELFQQSNGYTQMTRVNGFSILDTSNEFSYLSMNASANTFYNGSRWTIVGYKTS